MKKFSIVAVLVMMFALIIIPSVCNADVAGSYSVSSISVQINEPMYGKAPTTTGTAFGNRVQLSVSKIEWYDSNNTKLGNYDVLKDGKYTAVITVDKTGGSDSLRATTRVYLNDSSEGVTNKTELCSSTRIVFSKEYNIASRTVSNGRLSNVGGMGTVTLRKLDFTFEEPKVGENPVFASAVKCDPNLSSITVNTLNWVDDEAFLSAQDTFKAGKYECRLFFNLASGYTLAGDAIITINGDMVYWANVSTGGFKCVKEYTLTATRPSTGTTAARPSTSTSTTTRPSTGSSTGTVSRPESLKNVDIVVIEPKAGETFATTCKVTTNLDGEKEAKVYENEASARYVIDGRPTSSNSNCGYWLSSGSKVEAGKSYTFAYRFNIVGVPMLVDLPITINGKTATIQKNDTEIVATYKFEIPAEEKTPETTKPIEDTKSGETTKPVEEIKTEETKSGETTKPTEEKKWINQFDVSIESPKIGEKPATKAKANKDGFSISKVTWTPADSEFKAGVNYRVKINVEIDEGRDLRSDYYGMINGIQAKMPIEYDKKDFYIELSFGVLDKKVEWTKASDWAKPELDKANELSLIPTIFDKGDLTTNITRREFAHVAVKLYENIAGQKAIASVNNPFTDTDDTEILKAYNVGITNGTSATTFAPDALITREQMATMMTRALEKAGIDTSIDLDTVPKFSDDGEMHDWGKNAIYFMSSIEIIKGIGDNKFGVLGNATKEQSLAISERSVEYFAK